MLFRYFCLQASLLVWRASLVLSVEIDNLIRCQKTGCRITAPYEAPPDGQLRGRRAQGLPAFPAPREAPPAGQRWRKPLRALVGEWLAVFALVRALSYVRHGVRGDAAPRLRATAAAMARAFDEACTAWIAGLRRPRKAGARRRAATARGSSASPGSLLDLIGSDDVSSSSSSESAHMSNETDSDSVATSNYTSDYTVVDSEATTVLRITTRAARKRGQRFDSCYTPASASSSSMCALTSSRRRVRDEVRSPSSSSSTCALAAAEAPTNAVARKKKAETVRPLAEAHYDSPYCESDSRSSYSSSGYDASESSAGGYVSSGSIVSRMLDYLTTNAGAKSTEEATPGDRRGWRCSRGDEGLGKAYTRPLRYGGRQRRVTLDAFPHGNGMTFRYAAGQDPTRGLPVKQGHDA